MCLGCGGHGPPDDHGWPVRGQWACWGLKCLARLLASGLGHGEPWEVIEQRSHCFTLTCVFKEAVQLGQRGPGIDAPLASLPPSISPLGLTCSLTPEHAWLPLTSVALFLTGPFLPECPLYLPQPYALCKSPF